MRAVDIIEKKRNGEILTGEEIKWLITNYTNETIPDYQMSALLMAIYFQGMNEHEASVLTEAMIASGDQINLSHIDGIKVDKHSTGGVGDTTTLILAPLVASVGAPIAKMSGRGLGHTGGTLDKLESIPGFHIELTEEEFFAAVNDHKIAVIGQTGNLTPADKRLYALRDVTGTVNSIPLIASSIMSKKIAAGSDAIVLDVKVGSGAFMKTLEDANRLGQTMVDIGNKVGRQTMVVVSDMSQPLGLAIGNALEVKEAIATLKGEGPADLTELVLTLGSQMVVLSKKAQTIAEARALLEEAIQSGKAIAKFKEFITNQGGDASVVDHPEKLAQATYQFDLLAKTSGKIAAMEAEKIGLASMLLGAGRASKEDTIDMAVGIVLNKKIGDNVEEEESILTIHSNREDVEEIKALLYDNITIADSADTPSLILNTITK